MKYLKQSSKKPRKLSLTRNIKIATIIMFVAIGIVGYELIEKILDNKHSQIIEHIVHYGFYGILLMTLGAILFSNVEIWKDAEIEEIHEQTIFKLIYLIFILLIVWGLCGV